MASWWPLSSHTRQPCSLWWTERWHQVEDADWAWYGTLTSWSDVGTFAPVDQRIAGALVGVVGIATVPSGSGTNCHRMSQMHHITCEDRFWYIMPDSGAIVLYSKVQLYQYEHRFWYLIMPDGGATAGSNHALYECFQIFGCFYILATVLYQYF